jgi:hypothetical protein
LFLSFSSPQLKQMPLWQHITPPHSGQRQVSTAHGAVHTAGGDKFFFHLHGHILPE